MTAAEAAKLLDLAPGTAPEQIEARFADLRAKLEDKVAKAPTPGLRDKYRSSLALVTSAFETLTLNADTDSLPSLRRGSAATPSPARTPPPATPPPASTATQSAAAPSLSGPGSLTVALMHLTGFYKCSFSLIGFSILIAVGVAGLNAAKVAEDTQLIAAVCLGVAALALSILVWRLSVRRARRRFDEGKSNRIEHVIAVVLASLTALLLLGAVVAYRFSQEESRAMEAANRERTLTELRGEAADIEKRLAGYEQLVAAAEAKQRELDRALVGLRVVDPAEVRRARLAARAQGVYARYLRGALARHPGAVALRQRLEKLRGVLAHPPSGTNELHTLQQATYEVANREDEFARLLNNQDLAPNPELYLHVDEWRQAAEAGDVAAMWNLYVCHLRGPSAGLEFDPAARLLWLRRTAENGYASAMANLGYEYAHARPELRPGSFTEREEYLTKDYSAALSWYRKAAEAGSIWGMRQLGDMLLEGTHVPKDITAGFHWISQAAEKGDEYAMASLGDCYANGTGTAVDEKTAIAWWTKAALKDVWSAKEALKKRNLTW